MKQIIYWIYAQTIEIAAFLFLLILYLGTLTGLMKKHPIGQGRPVLLVHGYCNGGFVWWFLKKKLFQLSNCRIYTIDLGYPFDSIEAYAQKVAILAGEIRKETNRADLILIGHSMGGLVSAYYALFLAPVQTVSAVMTIGSPMRGTVVSPIGLGRCARQMERGSAFIKMLDNRLSGQDAVEFYHIATKTDELVIPYTSSWPKGAKNLYVIDCLGHVALLFSSRVAKKICQWVGVA